MCSGIEAASCAWHPLGWEPVAFSEIEKFPSSVLAHHYPTVPNWGDMTKFKEWPDATIDLLVGGTPCQSFSVAGLRKGLADPRGNLALTYLAIADKYRPEWLVWENVPGVLSSGGGRDFGSFLGGLGELGYGWAYRVLDAQYFGLAQRRKRVFVVASLGGWQRAAAVLFDSASLRGDSAPRREAGQGTAPSLAKSLRGCSGGIDREDMRTLIPAIANPLTARMHKGINTTCDEGQTMIAHSLRADGFDASEDGTGRGTPLVPVGFYQNEGSHGSGDNTNIAPTLKGAKHSNFAAVAFDTTQITSAANCSNPKPGDPCHPLASGAHAPAVAFDARQSDVIQYGEKTGPLDTDGHTMGIQAGMAVRRLTPRECERLQGFPNDYTLTPYRGKPAADGPRYKALGNSMAVPVMHWIGKRIQQVQDISKRELA